MNKRTRSILVEALEYCDREDKSTDFMIQFLMDKSGVDHDTVMHFLDEYNMIRCDSHDNG